MRQQYVHGIAPIISPAARALAAGRSSNGCQIDQPQNRNQQQQRQISQPVLKACLGKTGIIRCLTSCRRSHSTAAAASVGCVWVWVSRACCSSSLTFCSHVSPPSGSSSLITTRRNNTTQRNKTKRERDTHAATERSC
eukprot:COSAG05_NODE_9282_length_635_cov_0.598881_1_plen_138_part_00